MQILGGNLGRRPLLGKEASKRFGTHGSREENIGVSSSQITKDLGGHNPVEEVGSV